MSSMAISSRKQWEDELPSEVLFWENYLKTSGDKWPEEFIQRCDPNSRLQELLLRFIDKTAAKNLILDVGAGPLTIVNKRCDFGPIEIRAVDPLADTYHELLAKYGIEPLVRTEKCDGEKLTSKFAENSFDLTHSRNAIDHSYDPLKCIREMISVTKKNRFVVLQVFEREGSYARWNGLHQWDFSLERPVFSLGKASLMLRGRHGKKVDVGKDLKGVASVVELTRTDRTITAVFRKS